MKKHFSSATKQKALLLLAAGLVLGFSPSPRMHARIWKTLPKAWKAINRAQLRRIIKEFKYHRLVDFREEKDGTYTVVLTKLGKQYAVRYDPENISIKIPARWDGKWRVVIFDIPEKRKGARDALRWELKKLGFVELQRSVWVFPYECRDQIDFIVEMFEIREHVYFLEVSHITQDAKLRLHFDLP